jgi:tetratricopeptide (TPR) repeat protein
MKRNLTATVVSLVLLVTLFAGSVLTLRKVETLRGKEATLEEILYLPSGKMLKRMSLGYSNLLADIYWTRAVQYFGSHFDQRSTRYDLLNPLLEITTDLDPHLIPAYQTGSIFLSQEVPQGAGQPDKAVALVEKGIRENPEYWRLYFTLGFIHYIDRRDYKAAEEAFKKGSEVPGALVWMKVMAARMAEHGGDIGTASALWKGIYDGNTDKTIRNTAIQHLISLQADSDIGELEGRVQDFRRKTGSLPSRWSDLVRAGLLRGIPPDPTGAPYELMADGTVQVKDRSKFPFLGEFLQGQARANK